MKKLICMLLCLVFVCGSLVACSEDEYGYKGEYDEYYSPDNRELINLDFYIIVGEGTTENAIKTVNRMINQYTSDSKKFTTGITMHYVTASEYFNTVKAAADDTTAARADIVLITGEEMFDYFNDKDLLVNIADYYDSTDFGKIKNNIQSTVLSASYITDGNDKQIFTVPNNNKIDSYDFILINKAIAEQEYNFGTDKTLTWNTYEDTKALRDLVEQFGKYEVEEVVRLVPGGVYSDIAKYEAEGFICNIAKYPTVTKAEAFKSAFAIVKDNNDKGEFNLDGTPVTPTYDEEGKLISVKAPEYIERYYRAMEIIYSLNTDVYFRNLLQYGVSGTNYHLVDATVPDAEKYVIPVNKGSNVYNMDLLYTGDLFNAYYCEQLGWTDVVYQSIYRQNEESVFPSVKE